MPNLIRWGRNFHAASGHEVPFDGEHMLSVFREMIDSDDGILLIGDHGAIGGVMVPIYFNPQYWMAQEIFWWVEPDSRGAGLRLLDAFEIEAEVLGAHVVAMSCLGHNDLGKLYARRGYRLSESSYMKVL